MDRVYSYLTLSAFEKCNAVQAFLAVYGGYFISVGRIFYPTDLLYGDGIGFSFKMGNVSIMEIICNTIDVCQWCTTRLDGTGWWLRNV